MQQITEPEGQQHASICQQCRVLTHLLHEVLVEVRQVLSGCLNVRLWREDRRPEVQRALGLLESGAGDGDDALRFQEALAVEEVRRLAGLPDAMTVRSDGHAMKITARAIMLGSCADAFACNAESGIVGYPGKAICAYMLFL